MGIQPFYVAYFLAGRGSPGLEGVPPKLPEMTGDQELPREVGFCSACMCDISCQNQP